MIDFREIPDEKLLTIYSSNPEMGLEMIYKKYEYIIPKARNIYNFAGFDFDLRDLSEIVKKSQKDLIISNENNDKKEIIGKAILAGIDRVIRILYKETEMEIPYASYKDYLMMIAGKSERDLYHEQMSRFAYVDRPLIDERDQIYDSLNIIEGYLFDLDSNGEGYTPEQEAFINGIMREIRECLVDGDIERAKYKLVSLQMLFHMDIRFYPVLRRIIEERLPLRNFIDLNNTDNFGKGRIK